DARGVHLRREQPQFRRSERKGADQPRPATTEVGFMKMTMLRVLCAALMMSAIASLAPAHHSFARFDMGSQKTITGTVKTVEWTNPHTWIWLDVPNEQGVVEPWGFEGMSPNSLARRGGAGTPLRERHTHALR